MPATAKALVVILLVGVATFWLLRTASARFIAPADYQRRAIVWIALSTAAFLLNSFWLFALIAIPLIYWAGRKDQRPLGLYLLLLHVIPNLELEIPTVGIESLFPLGIYRMLSLFLLIPALNRLPPTKSGAGNSRGGGNKLDSIDYLAISYGLLQVILTFGDTSITGSLRRFLLYILDDYIVFRAVRRLCRSREDLADAMFSFCISCIVMATIAVFESTRHWLLYQGDFLGHWGLFNTFDSFYNTRGEFLRAVASSGNTLALAYLLAIGIGFLLGLSSRIGEIRVKLAMYCALTAGLIATFSRGPWLGAILIYLVFAALNTKSLVRLVKPFVWLTAIVTAIGMTPLGSKIVQFLPFMGGTVDIGSVTYRQALAARSWELIMERPFFGDTHALNQLEDFRQGQGIIDLVNTYIGVALFNGLVGLALFLGVILVPTWQSYWLARARAPLDREFALLGFSIISCVMGTLVMIASCSLISGYEKLYYVLAAMAAAYVGLGSQQKMASGRGRA